jgi:CRP-like cAMP-binding protein
MSQKLELLNKVDIFKSLDDSTLNRIENILEKSLISAGEDLAVKDGQALYFFILISGRVMLYTKDEKAVVFNEPGDFMGFDLLSEEGKYKASVKSLEDGEVFLLDRKKLLEMIEQDLLLAENIMGALEKYLSEKAPFIEKVDFTGRKSIY